MSWTYSQMISHTSRSQRRRASLHWVPARARSGCLVERGQTRCLCTSYIGDLARIVRTGRSSGLHLHQECCGTAEPGLSLAKQSRLGRTLGSCLRVGGYFIDEVEADIFGIFWPRVAVAAVRSCGSPSRRPLDSEAPIMNLRRFCRRTLRSHDQIRPRPPSACV